jgi:hypothetical protein
LMALAVVVCRIVGRYLNGVKLWLDDWFAIASVVSSSLFVLVVEKLGESNFVCVAAGSGKRPRDSSIWYVWPASSGTKLRRE